jgi:hypothetical protein
MNKRRFLLIALILGLVLAIFPTGATGETPQLKVQKAVGVTGAPDVYNIPIGSTITHLPDGSTKIIGPDGALVISAKSGEVGLIPTPAGMAKATHVYDIPSGSFVHGASLNTVEVYDADGKLILTVIDQAAEAGSGAVLASPDTYPPSPYAGDGWIEWTQWLGPCSFSYFYASWLCPAAPVNDWIDDDVVYLFNGIDGEGNKTWAGQRVLLQPVLEFNQDGMWPGNPLTGRVWVVNSNSQYYRTSAIGVAVGNILSGQLYLADATESRWQATILNQSTHLGAILVTDLLGKTGQWITTALEGWHLERDNRDLFGTANFQQMVVYDEYGAPIFPSWAGYIEVGAQEYFDWTLGVVIYGSSHVRLKTGR